MTTTETATPKPTAQVATYGPRSLPLAVIDLLIRRHQASDPRVLFRQRLLIGSSLGLGLATLALFAVSVGLRPASPGAYGLVGLGLAAVAATPLWLHLTSIRRASYIALLALNATLIYGAWLEGGPTGPVAPFLVILPALSALLLGIRGGVINALALLLFAVISSTTSPLGAEPTPVLSLLAAGLSMAALLGVLTLFAGLHRRQARSFALARDEAIALSEAKSRFLSVMSHELRTPMVGVLGAVDLLERTRAQAEQRKLIGVLRRSAQAQLKLIGNILDLSRIEADQLEIEHTSIDLRRLLSDLSAMFRTAAEAKGLSLRIDVGEGLPGRILGDAFRLQQVLGNLLNNAIKFTDRGEIQVTARARPGEFLEFRVRDTGVGFPTALGEEIFTTFVQADNTTARRFGGSGLGLAICRRLIAAMGGTIHAHSDPGAGSTFTVTLPAPLPSDSAEHTVSQDSLVTPGSAARGDQVRATVLLADDEAVNRVVVSAMLATLGHEVLEATNGREALELLERESVDIVLLGMHMPELDGPAVVERIRSGEQASLPVIGLTADVVREHLDRYLEHGLDEILTKPIGLEGLRDALDRALGVSERPASASECSMSSASAGVLL